MDSNIASFFTDKGFFGANLAGGCAAYEKDVTTDPAWVEALIDFYEMRVRRDSNKTPACVRVSDDDACLPEAMDNEVVVVAYDDEGEEVFHVWSNMEELTKFLDGGTR